MKWDLGLWGVAYLVGMSLAFGAVAHLIAGRVTTRWMWLLATAGFFISGVILSEVCFGWADGRDLQPNIDGLSRDEVLLAVIPGIVAMVLLRRWGQRRRDATRTGRGAPTAA